ncbi:MAG: glycosyltransferase [Acholeplasmatales bacterium]
MICIKIVYVVDSYGEFSNGTTMTAKRSKEKLEALGHEVSIVSTYNTNEKGYYRLKKRYIPIVTHFADKQKMIFAAPDKKVYEEAFKDADVVHLFMPFKASKVARKVAKKMNIPVTGAFHTQPEHISYGMGLGRFGRPIAWLVYRWFKLSFFNKVKHIHCPTKFIANELKRQNYKKNITHVITNGINESFFTNPTRVYEKDEYTLLTIGRYSSEKRQKTLLKAIAHSKYRNRIKVILAGQGPEEKRLKSLAKKLKLKAEFNFYSTKDLIKTIENADLYIHPAEAEIEGISALEAIASGLVPIVADSRISATKQFTLDERSLFKVRDHKELAKKIDYWLDNPDEREAMSSKYQDHIKNYNIDTAVSLLEEMFKEAVIDYAKEQVTKSSKENKKYKKRISAPRLKRAISSIIYYGLAIPVFTFYFLLIRRVKIKGRKNLKNLDGAVIISNHVHSLDSVMGGVLSFPRKPIFTSMQDNFKHPVYGRLVNILGATPTPKTMDETKIFFTELKKHAAKGRLIYFFPEGELISGYRDLREFKKGAFKLAEEAKVPIVPVRISFAKKQKARFFKERITVNIGKPIYPNIFLLKRDSIEDLYNKAFDEMSNLGSNYIN